jgi:hypothetical protein
VSAVRVRAGEWVEGERPVVLVARPGAAVLSADAESNDADRLSPGQRATARIEGGADDVEATVRAVIEGTGGVERKVQFEVSWPTPEPPFGTVAVATVRLAERDLALLVPQRAIRSAGARRYVEVQDVMSRRVVDVTVGIVANGQAEITKGLTLGQQVIVTP